MNRQSGQAAGAASGLVGKACPGLRARIGEARWPILPTRQTVKTGGGLDR